MSRQSTQGLAAHMAKLNGGVTTRKPGSHGQILRKFTMVEFVALCNHISADRDQILATRPIRNKLAKIYGEKMHREIGVGTISKALAAVGIKYDPHIDRSHLKGKPTMRKAWYDDVLLLSSTLAHLCKQLGIPVHSRIEDMAREYLEVPE